MMPLSFSFFAANYYSVLETLAALVAVLILISAADDLFIDLWYWARRLYRRFAVQPNYRPLTVAQLRDQEEQPIAIMVPAWLEYDVIASMIEHMVATLEYRNYVVFVGTYVNDAATNNEVERMRRRYKQLRRVEVPHPGPTCKADCLNWIIKAIFEHEREAQISFAGVVLHDSEDVIHGLELKFFNYLLPRKDMIQLPVASLEREWYELVAGTYMDEFAESHAKDMVVRESVAGIVPSAGVGTCFSRRALKALIADTDGQPFNTNSLTEDYDVGNRLSHMGMQSIFAIFPVQFLVQRKAWFSNRAVPEQTIDMPLCVREYFPDTFHSAYRQKARWVLGIGLQSWEQIAWQGSLASRYLLLRDRKGVLTAFISILAYLLVIQFVAFYLAARFDLWTTYYPPLLSEEGWWRTVMYLNAGAMLIRAAHRIYFVTPLYGWRHGLMSLPRMVVANFINFMAVARAWKMFLSYLFFGSKLAWDKTMHEFPTEGPLSRRRQRLGDLLKSWQAVDEVTLDSALEEQSRTNLPLGSVMVAHGWLDEETLAEAISYQENLPRTHLSRELVQTHAAGLAPDVSVRLRTLYIGRDDALRPMIAVASALSESALSQLSALLGALPSQKIVRESEIISGLRLLRGKIDAFEPDSSERGTPLLGDLLIAQGLLQRAVFDAAMQQYRPNLHGRIGDYLVDQGVLARQVIEQAMAEQRRSQAGSGASIA
jgi:adsorption protein B